MASAQRMHEEPQVPTMASPAAVRGWTEGMVLAIEPMSTPAGGREGAEGRMDRR